MSEIRLKSSQERLERVKIGLFRRANRGDIDAMVQFIARFMVDENGAWMSQADAEAALDELDFIELKDALAGLQGALIDSAAPKANATPSSELSS